MKKYDVWFCHCGRVHFMPWELWDWMQGDCEHRCVIQVCQNCGATVMHFLTENGEGFDMNGVSVRDQEFSTGDGMEYRFLFHSGERVPLKCGEFADAFQAGKFMNWDFITQTYGQHTYLSELEKNFPSLTTVDTEWLIREIKDPDKLHSMSGYAVGIDWTGTEYDWRKKNND